MEIFTVDEINLICCCKEDTRADTVEVMTAIKPIWKRTCWNLQDAQSKNSMGCPRKNLQR